MKKRVNKRFGNALPTEWYHVERFAQRAWVNAMYAYSFGIVGNLNGHEGRSLGTGIGVCWNDIHLVLTAAHTLADTPVDRLYLMVPASTLEIGDSLADVDRSKVLVQTRGQFEGSRVVISKENDLAAVVLPHQSDDATQHFYRFDSRRTIAPPGTVVGLFGYPACRAKPMGVRANYAVLPFCDLGQVCIGPINHNHKTQLLVKYYAGAEVDPHGLSGGGIWNFKKSSLIWSPKLVLAGLMTNYDRKKGVIIGYRVATLLRFLRKSEGEMQALTGPTDNGSLKH
ncbi:MAG: hypothetical protein AABO57_09505 [Acidobacteriota bacterium]